MKNDDPFIDAYLEGVLGVVEANSFESLCIWKEYHEEKGLFWEQRPPGGYGVLVGTVSSSYGSELGCRPDDMPVFLHIMCYMIDGCKLLFIHPTSIMVDTRMIDDWLNDSLPESAFDISSRGEKMRLNRANAQNFHNVFTTAREKRDKMKRDADAA